MTVRTYTNLSKFLSINVAFFPSAQPANNQYFFKVGSFIVSYVCQKNSAIIVLPGVYTNKKTNLTSADITSLTTALQKNGIAFKTDVTKLNVPSCKYTLT